MQRFFLSSKPKCKTSTAQGLAAGTLERERTILSPASMFLSWSLFQCLTAWNGYNESFAYRPGSIPRRTQQSPSKSVLSIYYMGSRGLEFHFVSYLIRSFSNDTVTLQRDKSSQNKGTAMQAWLSPFFSKWRSSTNVFLPMKADFSKAPESNAWWGLPYIPISEMVCDMINPYCGVWWQIVSAAYQVTQENICGYKRNLRNPYSPF